MKVGQLTTVPVNDEVTLILNIDWGQYKKLVKEIDALPNEDPATLDAVGEKVCAYIHSIRGVEDKDGNPVTKVTPEVLDTFSPGLARAIVRAVTSIGQQGSGGVVPPAGGSDS